MSDAYPELWVLLSEAYKAINSDLQALLQVGVKLTPKAFSVGATEMGWAMRGPGVIATTVIEAGVGSASARCPTHFVFKSPDAVTMVGTLMLMGKAALGERRKLPMNEREVDGFREIANQICGSANLAFDKLEKHLRVSQNTEHLKVAWTKEIERSLPPGPMVILPVGFTLEGYPPSECAQILPADGVAKILSATAKA